MPQWESTPYLSQYLVAHPIYPVIFILKRRKCAPAHCRAIYNSRIAKTSSIWSLGIVSHTCEKHILATSVSCRVLLSTSKYIPASPCRTQNELFTSQVMDIHVETTHRQYVLRTQNKQRGHQVHTHLQLKKPFAMRE